MSFLRNLNIKDIKGDIVFKGTCGCCDKPVDVELKYQSLKQYLEDGVPIQTAFSYLNTDSREFLLSRLCPDCFEVFANHNNF